MRVRTPNTTCVKRLWWACPSQASVTQYLVFTLSRISLPRYLVTESVQTLKWKRLRRRGHRIATSQYTRTQTVLQTKTLLSRLTFDGVCLRVAQRLSHKLYEYISVNWN